VEEFKLKIADLDEEGEAVRVAKGGLAGLGNFSVCPLYIFKR
jgi:GTPase involved in cell partitioning and DNA repair